MDGNEKLAVMEKDYSFEIRRAVFHMCLGLLFAVIIFFGFAGWKIFLGLLLAGVILSYAARKRKIPVISWFLCNFERKGAWPGKGAIFFVAGTLAVLVLFPKEIALASIMILAFGDSLAHLFGSFFGKVHHPWNTYKMIEGTIMGFLAGGVAASVFVPWTQAFIASGVAMFIEGFEVKFGKKAFDDNLLVPLVAGVVLWLLRSWVFVPI
jgi:phytol kinase